jgi:hypothetical protein
LRAAPSTPPPTPTGATPAVLVDRLLGRFGDRRYLRAIHIARPPPITLQHLPGYFAGRRPPRDARWAWIAAAATTSTARHPTPTQLGAAAIAQWEAALAAGALRDDFCTAGGPPLVGWTIGRGGITVSDSSQALRQHFPNPTSKAFRHRLDLVAHRYGFTVTSLRLLHPEQLAPLLIIHTKRGRKAFVHDIPAIMRLLDPISQGHNRAAVTFEGFLLQADDNHGPFVRIDNVYRGETEGGEWSSDPCSYPYPHSTPFSSKPCP